MNIQAQSPHGTDFKMNCAACHTPDGWGIPTEVWENDGPLSPQDLNGTTILTARDTALFNHDFETDFSLLGGHASTDCRLCHQELVFTNTSMDCISCHEDMHRMTVGNDCARCHTVENWLVDNITELHEDNGFPLLGAHAFISCEECHAGESSLEFNRLGNECLNCHLEDYVATTDPHHAAVNFSTNCVDCHDISGFDWSADGIRHDFFPLEKGHDIQDCSKCHVNPDFTGTPTECFACHQMDYESAVNPNHSVLNFNTDCTACHTLDLDWMPAEYMEHDNDFFPIYSGSHQGEWDNCTDCHLNPSNYAEFTCTTCHGKDDTDGEHDDVSGYVYESRACLLCHPTGDEDDNFDHDGLYFPIYSGTHQGEWDNCVDCHTTSGNYALFSCIDCHEHNDPNDLADEHDEVNGYQYVSVKCLECHPNGD